jgi:3-phosphoshikimate 1-carboxyvinyltransferase
MKRIVEPLSLMGAVITAREGNHPPLTIKGARLKAIDYEMAVPSAQVKSAILLAGLYADGVTTIEEKFKSRDHTERIFSLFGADIGVEGLKISVKGWRELEGKDLEIPGDISSAAFFMVAAAMLKGSRIRIKAVGINPTRAGILNVIERMGGRIKLYNRSDVFEPTADIEAESSDTRGTIIKEAEVPSLIDELPAIFVLAVVSKGVTVIEGARELRVKETDRIMSMEKNLKAMGGKVSVEGEKIIIEGVPTLKGAAIKSFGDHRTCMAMAISALKAEGESSIDDAGCVNKSFPGFFDALGRLYVK